MRISPSIFPLPSWNVYIMEHISICPSGVPTKTKHLPDVWPMLDQRRRRWANIGQTLVNVLCLLGYCCFSAYDYGPSLHPALTQTPTFCGRLYFFYILYFCIFIQFSNFNTLWGGNCGSHMSGNCGSLLRRELLFQIEMLPQQAYPAASHEK